VIEQNKARRYSIKSIPAGPLLKSMLTSAGFSFFRAAE